MARRSAPPVHGRLWREALAIEGGAAARNARASVGAPARAGGQNALGMGYSAIQGSANARPGGFPAEIRGRSPLQSGVSSPFPIAARMLPNASAHSLGLDSGRVLQKSG